MFLTMLNKDICQIIYDYPQYFDPRVSDEKCENVLNGILSRGFIIAMKEISLFFSGFLPIYDSLENSPTYSSDLINGLVDL